MRSEAEVEEYKEEAQGRYTSRCSKCSGTDRTCSCWKRYRQACAAYEASVPRDFWGVGPEDVVHNVTAFKNIVQPYCERLSTALKGGYGLLLLGDNGVGKTMFQSYVMMQAIKNARTAYYTTLPQLDWDIKKGFNDWRADKRLAWLLSSDFLAIDEMGKERSKKSNEYSDQQIERILKQRFDNSMPVIIASNMDIDEIVDAYGSTIGSMLKGKFQTVNMEPGDFRDSVREKMMKEMVRG